MHYHCEIVIPPTDDVKTAVAQIMGPFDESASSYRFWDWYVIGGRWAGAKMEAAIGQDRIEAFRAELRRLNITISGIQVGKPELNPVSQIETVDALWAQWFPEHAGPCPLFAHSNNNRHTLPGDISPLASCPLSLTASRVIVAARTHDDKDFRADWMTQEEVFNGVNYERTTWDKTLGGALNLYSGRIARYSDEARIKYAPRPDWLIVTVDYHS